MKGVRTDYIFGDTDIAAQRLKLLAEVFAPSTQTFLGGVRPKGRLSAVDLGCGPGYTTRLLASVLRCDRTIGIDSSEHFISLARKTAMPGVLFHVRDVNVTPFPFGLVDIIYFRFLITHLREHRKAFEGWAAQLGVGGLLIAEETEWIRSRRPAFNTYIGIVEKMLETQGNILYAGKLLDAMGDAGTLKRRENQVARVPVRNRIAAAMFLLNMLSWKDHAFIRENYRPEVIAALERDLRSIADDAGDKSEIEWGIRQTIFEREL